MQVGRLSELGPRSVWDILDDAFDLYRERWVLLCGATALVYVPVYGVFMGLIRGPMLQFLASGKSGSSTDTANAMGAFFGSAFLLLPLTMAAYVLQSGATAAIVRDVLTERRITTIREAYALPLKRFWPLLLGAIGVGLATTIGMCGFFVGALYAATLLAFVPQLVLLEGRGIADAFRRSQRLVRPEWGRVLGLFLMVGMISSLLQGGLSLIIGGGWALIPHSGDAGAQEAQQAFATQAFNSIATLLMAPLQGIAVTLLYYDLRVRREGFDLIAQAEAISYPLAPDPFGEVSSEEARERILRDQRKAERRARRGK